MNLFKLLAASKAFTAFKKEEIVSCHDIKSLALFIATYFLDNKKKIAIIVPSLYDANRLYEELSYYLDEDYLTFFPVDEVLRIDSIGSSKEMLEQRLFAMEKTKQNEPNIFITHLVASMRPLVSKERFTTIDLQEKSQIDPLELERQLISLGYYKVDKVSRLREFAHRGEVFDIFGANQELPVRLDFFDDEIESMRSFDIATQRSMRDIKELKIIPASDLLLSPSEETYGIKQIRDDLHNSLVSLGVAHREILTKHINQIIEKIHYEGIGDNYVRFYHYFFSNPTTIISYLNSYEIIDYDKENLSSTTKNYLDEYGEYHHELFKAGLALNNELQYLSNDILFRSEVKEITAFDRRGVVENFKIDNVDLSSKSILSALENINYFLDKKQRVLISLSNERYSGFFEFLNENKVEFETVKNFEIPERLGLSNYEIEKGFVIPEENITVLSAKEIFGADEKKTRFLTRYKEAKILKSYDELKIGDYVVHEESGIGVYKGIVTLATGKHKTDYLQINYVREDVLYVPLEKFKLIRKYSGRDGAAPHIDRLGSSSWALTKERIKHRVAFLADKLLEISAARKEMPGFAFMPDDETQLLFEKNFPYQLTLDQERSVEEIKQDMESTSPMDRLLAGDVGFGKTEVAFRAAFKAMLSGKQVALLCPTTILAKQHYEVAIERFRSFGVNVKALTRFVSKSEQKKIIADVSVGKVHLLIGTHRLLSADIRFQDLGLLIVDEEQRFGVTHKEKIKQLCQIIDVLTLSATPIPRTMQMSLLGLRTMSTLASAPRNRMPIQTYVVKYNIALIKEVIARELGRKGQVYYLHNIVRTIYDKANKLQAMFPRASVGVVHGQMDADAIEEVMSEFYEGRIDILVCTSIIETGLDVSNVNTLIIERAQFFGLSQLYQIKGRVGRSTKLAYAYLFYDDYDGLTDEGRKRFKAIKEFAELGSGYKIAMRDLSIRGAGDILGAEQAGFIDSIGADMYFKLLDEVIQEKKLMKLGETKAVNKTETRFKLAFTFDSFVPSSYASDDNKIEIYKELFDLVLDRELEEFEKKLRDIYGDIPPELANLLLKKKAEIYLEENIFEKVEEEHNRISITLSPEFSTISKMGTYIYQSLLPLVDKIDVRIIPNRFVILINKEKDYIITIIEVVSNLIKLFSEIGEKNESNS